MSSCRHWLPDGSTISTLLHSVTPIKRPMTNCSFIQEMNLTIFPSPVRPNNICSFPSIFYAYCRYTLREVLLRVGRVTRIFTAVGPPVAEWISTEADVVFGFGTLNCFSRAQCYRSIGSSGEGDCGTISRYYWHCVFVDGRKNVAVVFIFVFFPRGHHQLLGVCVNVSLWIIQSILCAAWDAALGSP